MILSFKQRFPDGTPNHFLEKIWIGLLESLDISVNTYDEYERAHEDKFRQVWAGSFSHPEMTVRQHIKMPAKLHTIRSGNRWKAGDKIHFAVNPRSKNYFQFAPVMEVVSVQTFVVKYQAWRSEFPVIFIDDYPLHIRDNDDIETLGQLAVNEGFKSFNAMCEWFSEDFTGQIIHWTPLKYCTQ